MTNFRSLITLTASAQLAWWGQVLQGAVSVMYYHIVVLSYHHMIILSNHSCSRYDYSHFCFQVEVKNTNHLFYPLAKGRINKINASKAMTSDGGPSYHAQTSVAPRKHLLIDFTPIFVFAKKFHPKFFSDVEKWNVANRLKRVFPKFRADRSHPRGVNDRLKFSRFERPDRPRPIVPVRTAPI